MKSNNGIIIAFEGLDCSFKETNYNSFVQKMEEKYGKEKIFTESFPRYDNESAINVKKWLQGQFDRDHLMKYPLVVNSLYSIDRLSYWYEKDESENCMINLLKDQPDNFFCFDRYNFSNSIYNPKNSKYGQKIPCIDDFNFDSYTFGIPNPNIVVWMRMKNFDVLAELLSKKEGKDKNEVNLEFIHDVWERMEYVIKWNYCKELGIKSVIAECLDENNNIRSREDIANDIWNQVSKRIEEIKESN